MGLLQWLFGRSKAQESSYETSPKISPNIISDTSPKIPIKHTGPEKFLLQVVGESYYQDDLKHIFGEYSFDGINVISTATLIHADDNQYDHEAIRVEISGKTVGHMSKTEARMYRAYMRSKNQSGLSATCKAKIAGGWDRGDGDIGNYGVSLDLPSDLIELSKSAALVNRKENTTSEPNTIIFDVEKPHLRDLNEIGANVNLWIPKDDPQDVYVFHRDGPDGRIGTVPLRYANMIIAHIINGLEYEATILELSYSLCKIKCRLIPREESELKKKKKMESLKIELTKPYNPQKPITITFVMEKKKSAKVGDKLSIEFDSLDSYVQGQSNIKFLNQTGDVIGIYGYDNVDKMRRLVKAYFNSLLFDIEVLDIEKERNKYLKGYRTKLIVKPYKANDNL